MATDMKPNSVTERILNAVIPIIYGRRVVVSILLALLTAFFLWETLQVRPDAGFDKSIPLEHEYMHVYKQYETEFGGANTVLVALVQKDGDIYNEEFLSKLKAVTDAVFFLPGVDRSRVSSLFTPDVRYLEVVEGGFRGGNVIPADYQPTPEMFKLVRGNVAKAGVIGRYVSSTQNGAMVYAELLETDPISGDKLDYQKVAADLEKIREKYETDDIKVHIVGFAKVVGDVTDATMEVVGFFLIAVFGTMLALWWYLGSFRLALLPMGCSIVAVIWEFGLLRLFGFGLDPFAILVPFLVLAVSTSHGVQYVNTWADEVIRGRNSYDSSVETYRRLAIPGIIALITDLSGFLTIQLVPIEIVREMSWNASFGMLAIIVTNKVMMPIWLSYLSVKDVDTFRVKRQAKLDAGDKLWRAMTVVTKPSVAIVLIIVSAGVLGFSWWKQQDRIIGDAQVGVPELRPESRYNQDSYAITQNFAIGVDILKVIAETDPEACIKYNVMEQIDRFAWRMQNTPGVQSTISLPQVAKQVNSAFSEANPKYLVLPRNHYVMVQAISPVPTSTGLLNPDCSAMAVLIFTADHKAQTIAHIVEEAKRFQAENDAEFFETHQDVEPAYCANKTETRREIGIAETELARYTAALRKSGMDDDGVDNDRGVTERKEKVNERKQEYAGLDKVCPVNFAIASANVGVMAATNEVVEEKEFGTIFWVYVVITIFLLLSYRSLSALIAVVLPLFMVSILANALMAMFGIGLKVATLPVVALAVGIGVDYGIYIYDVLQHELYKNGRTLREAYFETLRQTGKAVIFTGICLAGGVATWLLSDLQFQRDMGLLLVVMFSANMLGAVILLPAYARFIMKLPNG